MDELLLFLLKKEAHRNACRMTTGEIALATCMSQQNVSRRLQLLENAGKITRKREGIVISADGVGELKSLLATLKNSFGTRVEIKGIIANGSGKGKFYLSQKEYKKQFQDKVGFDPYPGTLNIKLNREAVEKRRQLLQMDPVIIEGFEKQGREFGDLFLYKAKINKEACAVVLPLRTRHGEETIEIAAPFNLRKKLGKKQGNSIVLEIE
jgi:riboflavin kinase